MKRTFIEAIERRRSYYAISAAKSVSEEEIVHTIDRIMLAVPSAYNSQSTRIVVLFGIHHICLWGIVKQALSEIITAEAYIGTREKIDNYFAAGCGTVLFYEDMEVVESMKKQFPTYADKFEEYSAHTSAMHQFAIWTAIEELGFGASLQHYNPLIDEAVAAQWDIAPHWRLVAQMPFGTPLSLPSEKTQHLPLSARRKVFSE
ncbi:MAG: nitroreductase family protein [Alistipes sp.]|nr:nitroreductase family protein [Alistipes sp.]